MKYRRLDREELEEMEPEFVRFLATHGIPAADWVEMKEKDKARAESYIDEFSDLVLERILQNISYLEMRVPEDIKVFKCGPEKMELMGLKVEEAKGFDFTQKQSPEEMMKNLKSSGGKLQLYAAEKPYKGNRELELFHMLEAGCTIADAAFFDLLHSLKF